MSFFNNMSIAEMIGSTAAEGMCAICDMPYGRWGNNGAPLVAGRVCDRCNVDVVEFRMDCAMGDCKDMDDNEREISAAFKVVAMKHTAQQRNIDTQKGVIEALRKSVEVEKENAKKYKDELDEIAKDGCVAPMMDRVMADAKKDVDDAEAKVSAKEEEVRVHRGHRAQNHRCLMIAAEGLFLTDCMEDIDNYMEDINDGNADATCELSFCVAHPTRPNAATMEMVNCSNEDVEEHMRAERRMVGEIVRKLVVGSVRLARIEVGPVRFCPHCEECNSMKITLTAPQ